MKQDETIKEGDKLYKWYDAHFPPIDLNANVSEVVKLISENKRLSASNKELREALSDVWDKVDDDTIIPLELTKKVNRLLTDIKY